MDLPDCPPGAEGYEDSVCQTAVKKSPGNEEVCTKAELEFLEHLKSLKVKGEDGSFWAMVERRGRDLSGKWIYLCFPCAATCSGEAVLQTHISGKKHKTKIALKKMWPLSIFKEHPYVLSEKGINPNKNNEVEKTLDKMAMEVTIHNQTESELESKFSMYRNEPCQIQQIIDETKAPLVGLEYLVEHPPLEDHHEPSYYCALCQKQGHPRTIINHMTCYWHRYHYISLHYRKASVRLQPYRYSKHRDGMLLVLNKLAMIIESTHGRAKPLRIEKRIFDKEMQSITSWIFQNQHCSEKTGPSFEEVVDGGLIESLDRTAAANSATLPDEKKDPSPPFVAAPSRPRNIRERRPPSVESLSDISGDDAAEHDRRRAPPPLREASRYAPYTKPEAFRSRYSVKNVPDNSKKEDKDKTKGPNYEYKQKLANDQRTKAITSARKVLAYHEKNPEKHPLYPEEWKKFWNKRYKEIQAEGKDPTKHDFKPEWIVFWTKRMKELHEEELKVVISEIYRKIRITPPKSMTRLTPEKSSDKSRRSTERSRSDVRRRTPDSRRRSPDPRRRSPLPRRRSPEPRRRSPEPRRRSPEPRRRSPELRRISPTHDHRPPFSDSRRRSPIRPERHRSPRRSPLRQLRTRSRSPHSSSRAGAGAAQSGAVRRSPLRLGLDRAGRSASPLSRRGPQPRNRSPAHHVPPNDGLSPWNSDNDIESIGSLPDAKSPIVRPRSRTDSTTMSRGSRTRGGWSAVGASDSGWGGEVAAADNVVATLRLLVALEDYLGSLGPKIVDLLTEALRMEKESANSSEELLERPNCVSLMETAKEKLKGATQAGLVGAAAAAAARAAIVSVAAMLHLADQRMQRAKAAGTATALRVAGVGQVDRAQIAQQMAAALVAQGKTDVSAEELAQLVDAVVGMAEEKKRQAESLKRAETQPVQRIIKPSPLASTSGSALQMLQSAYDEHEKKADITDAMDGLSDSDLETLLKNFNELSAEEQHSLIAYLKKLEAKEPRRVERLREYVSAAATTAPEPSPKVETSQHQPPQKKPEPVFKNAMNIESDDDDYTVEEVFNVAKEKVKEDQIRHEMEIIKKSLEKVQAATSAPEVNAAPDFDVNTISSAANLLAMVQASLAKTSLPVQSAPLDIVNINTHPRSFGDMPQYSQLPPKNAFPPQPSYSMSNEPIPGTNQGSFISQDVGQFSNRQVLSNSLPDYGQTRTDNQGPRHFNNQPSDHINPRGQDQGFNQGGQNQGFDQGGRNQAFDQGRPNQGFDHGRQNQNFDQGTQNQGFDQSKPNQGFGNTNQDFDNSNQNYDMNQEYENMRQDYGDTNEGYENNLDYSSYFGAANNDYGNSSQGYVIPNQGYGNINQSNNQGQGNIPNMNQRPIPLTQNRGGYNQGPPPNFNKPMRGNFRPPFNQGRGNYSGPPPRSMNDQNNFRGGGRGRANFGGPRGRGRGNNRGMNR